MQWTDEAIVLAGRPHGESSVLLECMTRAHGRHLGIVKGGRSRRHAASLQPGNTLELVWRARLDEHLGNYAVEPVRLRAAELMDSAIGLHALQTLAAHLRLLPERDPHPELYAAMATVVDHLADPAIAVELVIRFELLLLEALGFGLDLNACALTGAATDLAWVSPKSGRAATREAGRPHAHVLLALPPFLTGDEAVPPATDLAAGLRLTGHFLDRHVWSARAIDPPLGRDALVAAAARLPGGTGSRVVK